RRRCSSPLPQRCRQLAVSKSWLLARVRPASNAPGRGNTLIPRPPIRNSRTSPRATPPPCANTVTSPGAVDGRFDAMAVAREDYALLDVGSAPDFRDHCPRPTHQGLDAGDA